jgi:uncharacterized protein YjbJ (UPF0337 family)
MDYRKKDDTVGEEVSAFGERVKGAAKDAAGHVTGNERLERQGERENVEGRERQARNNVMDETDGVPGATVNRGSSVNRRDDDEDEAGWRGMEDGTGSAWNAGRGYVTGLYTTPESANRAYQSLTERHGYKPGDINVLMTDETRKRHFGDVKPGTEFKTGTKAAETGGKGAAIGGGIGAALAAIFAVGSNVVVPGLGLVIAGPIAAALAGAGAGAATGGVVGALIGAGIPKERAEAYDRGLKGGGIVLGTRARDDKHAADLEREFGEYGGTYVMK